MKHKLLLPNKYKKIGWFVFIPSFITGFLCLVNEYEPLCLNAKVFAIFPSNFFSDERAFKVIQANLAYTITSILTIIGCLLIGFSKEKNEDEYIAEIRLSSLLWAVFVNYSLLLIALFFIYELEFLLIMNYNMFTVLLIFILRFNYILFKNSKTESDEK